MPGSNASAPTWRVTQWRLNQDIRYGRHRAAAADAADLAHDRRALDAQIRDIRRDRRDRN
jgi:hypothetical protein